MNWQEELRKLDEELAAGRISADDYRTRRDQVLSSAQPAAQPAPPQEWQAQQPSGGPSNGPTGTSTGATQYIQPVNPDATQVVPGGGNRPGHNPDATQVVPGGGNRPGDSDRTQVVPNGGMAPQYGQPSPAGGFPQPGAFGGPQQGGGMPPWQGGGGDTSAPWASSSSDNWLRQGPEVFDEGSSGGGKKVFAIIGVVLVVALIGGAVWFFGFKGSGDDSAKGGDTPAPQSSTSAPTTTTTKAPIDLLPDPPGTPSTNNGTVELARAVEEKLLSADEAAAVEEAAVKEVAFVGSTQDAFTYDAMVFEVGDEAKAEALVEGLVAAQGKTGMVDGAKGQLPAQSTVQQLIRQGEPGIYRAIYAAGDKVVRVSTTQTPIAPGPNDQELIKKFQEFGIGVAKQFPTS
ncbi:hypothetical protein [Actinosynnema mirum]|uniref:SHOCT domain-containing protein n=1 Tax=Actinosynnema mirum (strain ATCC 29888 / DSM 43827 / JCM 3225 / NBRC 14064 / NCIMB 13271 / NRRL B-12336 / IMRU 3971 / 101) TaxID=446462 RepID=C6WDN5_ACTMD|nr:hypothetical protein [Actinosynnema mirum]ACU34030.1 hypothetical protein Amir_0056 [Actinosynnema mirum DSM 43827]